MHEPVDVAEHRGEHGCAEKPPRTFYPGRSAGEGRMYQLQVKRWLITHKFPVSEGWAITVDVDAMERARGGQHPPDKRAIAQECEKWLRDNGVKVSAHPFFGRADIVAESADHGTFVVEVEGDSSKQKEQAMYSSLGQIVLSMSNDDPRVTYGLALPDADVWEAQLRKIPARIKCLLRLKLYLVSEGGVREL